ncbi:MAG: hypothetical protein U1C74_26340 [Phenylobacterium sp.]|nr:hypothetical protein [Phenylobacterium sp.]
MTKAKAPPPLLFVEPDSWDADLNQGVYGSLSFSIAYRNLNIYGPDRRLLPQAEAQRWYVAPPQTEWNGPSAEPTDRYPALDSDGEPKA